MALFDILPVDRAFYRERLEDFLPERIFDTHTHIYKEENRAEDGPARTVSWPSLVAKENPMEDMEETARLLFPGKRYVPLMFSLVSRRDMLDEANAYVARCHKETGYPALLFTAPELPGNILERKILDGGFCGIKVYLNFAPAYLPEKEIRIFDFLSRDHLEICDQHGWTVMLHISRDGRLGDPVNLAQLLQIEADYKNLHLIVAHVGRAYCDADVGEAFEVLQSTKRMLFDFSANTNSQVFEQVIRMAGSSRILYGSDLPITRMRTRRIQRENTYVNLVPRGLYGDISADRHMDELDPPQSDDLTFFLYEEIEAFRQAALRTGLSRGDIERVFWGNAAALFGVQ